MELSSIQRPVRAASLAQISTDNLELPPSKLILWVHI